MATRLLSSVTTTGAGNSWGVRMGVMEHTVQCTFTGNPTAVTIELEGSLDNETWYQLAGHKVSTGDITDSKTMFHVTSKLVTYVRLNLTTLEGGTAPTLTAIYEGGGQ